jgi:hypothetical protein
MDERSKVLSDKGGEAATSLAKKIRTKMKRKYLEIDKITKQMDGHMLFAVKSKGGGSNPEEFKSHFDFQIYTH